jgi:membrane protein implicated in regulation of membrane protease activity
MGEWPESLAWLVAAGVLGIAEVLTLTLVLGLLGGAALLTAAAAALGAPAPLQFVIFGVMSIALLVGVLPVARRHRYSPGQLVSGAAALVGARGVALERIDATVGTAKISGEVWTARTADPHDVIEQGARVSVVAIQGATAIVYESEV